jgi:Fe/S biogenesis protein NfuA
MTSFDKLLARGILSSPDEVAGAAGNGASAAGSEAADGSLTLNVTDLAQEKIRGVLETQSPPVTTIRVSASAPGKYSMNLEPSGEPGETDTVLEFAGFKVFVDPQSAPLVDGAGLDYLETFSGGGFQFSPPQSSQPSLQSRTEPPEGRDGEIWREIEEILQTEINPAVASHGGVISLIDVRDSTVYVQLGGGCQGCGMASVTLKQGVERLIRDRVPDVAEILDVTDHAGGRNPYYAPSAK